MAGVVTDTSPLIALHQLGRFPLLQSLFGEVGVPPAVIHEPLRALRARGWRRLARPPLTALQVPWTRLRAMQLGWLCAGSALTAGAVPGVSTGWVGDTSPRKPVTVPFDLL